MSKGRVKNSRKFNTKKFDWHGQANKRTIDKWKKKLKKKGFNVRITKSSYMISKKIKNKWKNVRLHSFNIWKRKK